MELGRQMCCRKDERDTKTGGNDDWASLAGPGEGGEGVIAQEQRNCQVFLIFPQISSFSKSFRIPLTRLPGSVAGW